MKKPLDLARDEAGTTAIEFAIVAPLLLMLVAVIAETAAFSIIQYQLQLATDTAARLIRTGQVGPVDSKSTANKMDIATFKDRLCEKLGLMNCRDTIRVDVRRASSFSALQKVMPQQPWDVGPPSATQGFTETYSPGAPGDMGSLIVTYDWQFIIPSFTRVFGNLNGNRSVRRLAGTAVYRNEM